MQLKLNTGSQGAFTLVEALISLIIIVMVFTASLLAYTHSAKRIEWSGYYLSGQAIAVQQLERVRAALWDTQTTPITDNTTNLPMVTSCILQLPIAGTNVVWCTNTVTVTTLTTSVNPLSMVKMIVVQTVWPWDGSYYTNKLVTYRSPDQ